MIAKTCPELIRLAILNVDTPVPNVYARHGMYSDIFSDLLKAAAERLNNEGTLGRAVQFETTGYNCVQGEYPPDLQAINALLITGSSASSYDEEPWIKRLDKYVLDVFTNHPQIRIFGSCFGHQLLCQSLLRHHGAYVQRDPTGWELGVHTVAMNPDFVSALPVRLDQLPSYEKSKHESPIKEVEGPRFKAQFVHADHVVLPTSPSPLPQDWINLGTSQHCAVQGVLNKDRVLTLQGHFEFNRFVNGETIKVFGRSWDEKFKNAALKNVDQDDDSRLLAEIVVCFFAGGSLGASA